MDEKVKKSEPEVVMQYEHNTGSTWWFHGLPRELHAEMLPKNCSWKLLNNGDLLIATEIKWTLESSVIPPSCAGATHDE